MIVLKLIAATIASYICVIKLFSVLAMYILLYNDIIV